MARCPKAPSGWLAFLCLVGCICGIYAIQEHDECFLLRLKDRNVDGVAAAVQEVASISSSRAGKWLSAEDVAQLFGRSQKEVNQLKTFVESHSGRLEQVSPTRDMALACFPPHAQVLHGRDPQPPMTAANSPKPMAANVTAPVRAVGGNSSTAAVTPPGNTTQPTAANNSRPAASNSSQPIEATEPKAVSSNSSTPANKASGINSNSSLTAEANTPKAVNSNSSTPTEATKAQVVNDGNSSLTAAVNKTQVANGNSSTPAEVNKPKVVSSNSPTPAAASMPKAVGANSSTPATVNITKAVSNNSSTPTAANTPKAVSGSIPAGATMPKAVSSNSSTPAEADKPKALDSKSSTPVAEAKVVSSNSSTQAQAAANAAKPVSSSNPAEATKAKPAAEATVVSGNSSTPAANAPKPVSSNSSAEATKHKAVDSNTPTPVSTNSSLTAEATKPKAVSSNSSTPAAASTGKAINSNSSLTAEVTKPQFVNGSNPASAVANMATTVATNSSIPAEAAKPKATGSNSSLTAAFNTSTAVSGNSSTPAAVNKSQVVSSYTFTPAAVNTSTAVNGNSSTAAEATKPTLVNGSSPASADADKAKVVSTSSPPQQPKAVSGKTSTAVSNNASTPTAATKGRRLLATGLSPMIVNDSRLVEATRKAVQAHAPPTTATGPAAASAAEQLAAALPATLADIIEVVVPVSGSQPALPTTTTGSSSSTYSSGPIIRTAGPRVQLQGGSSAPRGAAAGGAGGYTVQASSAISGINVSSPYGIPLPQPVGYFAGYTDPATQVSFAIPQFTTDTLLYALGASDAAAILKSIHEVPTLLMLPCSVVTDENAALQGMVFATTAHETECAGQLNITWSETYADGNFAPGPRRSLTYTPQPIGTCGDAVRRSNGRLPNDTCAQIAAQYIEFTQVPSDISDDTVLYWYGPVTAGVTTYVGLKDLDVSLTLSSSVQEPFRSFGRVYYASYGATILAGANTPAEWRAIYNVPRYANNAGAGLLVSPASYAPHHDYNYCPYDLAAASRAFNSIVPTVASIAHAPLSPANNPAAVYTAESSGKGAAALDIQMVAEYGAGSGARVGFVASSSNDGLKSLGVFSNFL